MGSGLWSTNVYDAAARFRAATGASAFAYSDGGATTVHPLLDPRGVTRESRDSAEHPQSLAIAVLFDVTGSMRRVPRALQAKLPQLLGLLLRHGYAEHPQIMFGAIGDATCDRAPLQVGQFESDNRMDDDLGRILLEGGGGGQKTESYELALYFMARHTAIDCREKRGKRGYLFIIGDEMAYPHVTRGEAGRIIGDGLQADLPLAEMVSEVQRKWDTYNSRDKWQGPSRAGHLDAVALRYAIEATGGVDAIALTHLDTAARHPELRLCHAYQAAGQQPITRLAPGPARDLGYQQRLTEMLLTARPVYSQPGADWSDLVEQETGAPVVLRSHGPTAADKTGEPGCPRIRAAPWQHRRRGRTRKPRQSVWGLSAGHRV